MRFQQADFQLVLDNASHKNLKTFSGFEKNESYRNKIWRAVKEFEIDKTF